MQQQLARFIVCAGDNKHGGGGTITLGCFQENMRLEVSLISQYCCMHVLDPEVINCAAKYSLPSLV